MNLKKLLIVLVVSHFAFACAKADNNEMTGGQGPKIRDIDHGDDKNGGKGSDKDSNISDTSLPQAVGFYAEGKLINDYFFPDEAEGVIKVFRGRKRSFMTNYLANVIAFGAATVAKAFPGGERLQVGDTSKKGGGQLSLHASHQNGLDADIRYYSVNHNELNPDGFGGFTEIYVKNGKVTANFDVERNFELMKTFVSSGTVNRIFMDAAIKEKFCKSLDTHHLTALEIESLRRMRPLTNHQDHMHLRVKCPKTSPDCVTQVEPPSGTGCPAPGTVLINEFDPMEVE